ncbi:hypothetical protein [Paucibacter sp. M5-1]|uniref:hypothetical protein n=1 Tax=Paucibacter sp. M5-1 TaxID=3015998 RepID=UPI0022B89AA2|nr:hypothetical protein [Paucibacter sp. M5-1]MCZ7880346.1 hypothetical protein [Paucibacter sp. M5-1]
MDFYVDTTPLITPSFSWVSTAPFEPEKQARKGLASRTAFASEKSGIVDFFNDTKEGPQAPTALTPTSVSAPNVTPIGNESFKVKAAEADFHSGQDVDRIARRRVELMAAKYAGGRNTAEIVARLEILNNRLIERSPRITPAQVDALEEAALVVARSKATREERAKRLGLSI